MRIFLTKYEKCYIDIRGDQSPLSQLIQHGQSQYSTAFPLLPFRYASLLTSIDPVSAGEGSSASKLMLVLDPFAVADNTGAI